MLDLDPAVFGPVTAIAAFSAAGDACGYASIHGTHVDIHFSSPSATMGSAAGMPLVGRNLIFLPDTSCWSGANGFHG